ncbi:MAG: hypothetical protein IPK00_09495 [Deltaproteobacteria bacterium]|nr:hypothetical protein [Deltaproteobacteria bacterium]
MNGDRNRELGGRMVATGSIAPGVGSGTGAVVVGAPWFVQFWPLFILFLMVVSVGASLATVVIAYRHADQDVRTSEAIHERVR